MASIHLLPPLHSFRHLQGRNFRPSKPRNLGGKAWEIQTLSKFTTFHKQKLHPVKATVNGDGNRALESPSPKRRGRKKNPPSSPPSSASKKSKLSSKTQLENGTLEAEHAIETATEKDPSSASKKSKLSSKTQLENSTLEAEPAIETETEKVPSSTPSSSSKKSKLWSKTQVENGSLEPEPAIEIATEKDPSSASKKSKLWSETQVENGTLETEPAIETATEKDRSSASKKSKLWSKTQFENGTLEAEPAMTEDYDDEVDFPYDYPPLICCFGAVQKEFVPTVRVHDYPMHPDMYSEWKMLQWKPPEFVRAPGGPPSNVAVAHVRLGGRAAFMGKVGRDDYGDELVLMMNKEKVQTRAVKFDSNVKTACAYMRIKFEDGKMRMVTAKDSAEDSLGSSELNLAVLKEARIFHFNSEVLTCPSMKSTLFRAIALSKKFGGLVFFDLNLSLPLWRSRDETRETIRKAWNEADIIEVSRNELEFLLDEEFYERKRNYRPQYYAENYEQTKNRRDYYHYTSEEISPLWHDGLKFLFVTDGTLRIHYYTPSFDGVVVGTEDVLITPFTCDRTGSGDAVVAGILRKLTTCPEMFENQDVLERQLRFAIAAGIIAQWTIGAVRGFPTESATQNLKEQVYVPSMW